MFACLFVCSHGWCGYPCVAREFACLLVFSCVGVVVRLFSCSFACSVGVLRCLVDGLCAWRFACWMFCLVMSSFAWFFVGCCFRFVRGWFVVGLRFVCGVASSFV